MTPIEKIDATVRLACQSQLGEDSRRNPRQLLAPGIPAIGIDN